MALTEIKTSGIADDAITTDKLANAINTERTANTAKVSLEADSVTGAKIADDAVGAEHIEVLDANLQFGDSVEAQFGASNDLSISHDGNDAIIKTITGDLNLQALGGTSDDVLIAANDSFEVKVAATETAISATANGAVKLSFNGGQKLETSNTGGVLSGAWTLENNFALSDITYGSSTAARDMSNTSTWDDITSDNVDRTMSYKRGNLIVIEACLPIGIALQSDGINHGGMYGRLKISDGTNTAYGDTHKAWYRNDDEATDEIIQHLHMKYFIDAMNTTFDDNSTLTIKFQGKHIASSGTVVTGASRWNSNRWINVTKYTKST